MDSRCTNTVTYKKYLRDITFTKIKVRVIKEVTVVEGKAKPMSCPMKPINEGIS